MPLDTLWEKTKQIGRNVGSWLTGTPGWGFDTKIKKIPRDTGAITKQEMPSMKSFLGGAMEEEEEEEAPTMKSFLEEKRMPSMRESMESIITEKEPARPLYPGPTVFPGVEPMEEMPKTVSVSLSEDLKGIRIKETGKFIHRDQFTPEAKEIYSSLLKQEAKRTREEAKAIERAPLDVGGLAGAAEVLWRGVASTYWGTIKSFWSTLRAITEPAAEADKEKGLRKYSLEGFYKKYGQEPID